MQKSDLNNSEGELEETQHASEGTGTQVDMASDAILKHPLQNSWAFWYFKHEKGRDWLLSQKIVATFDTVEDFWA